MLTQKIFYWCALALAVVANVGANTALKIAMEPGTSEPTGSSVLAILQKLSFWVGLICAAVLLVSYLLSIRHIPVSIAYIAVSSLAMVGLVAVDAVFFGQTLTTGKIVGIGLVVSGLYLIARTA